MMMPASVQNPMKLLTLLCSYDDVHAVLIFGKVMEGKNYGLMS